MKASQKMFEDVMNISPTGLWLSDINGGLTYLNKTLVEMTGMSRESLLGPGWANAIVEEDRQKSIDAFINAIASRSHYDVLFRIRNAKGEIIWCRAAGDPYTTIEGDFAGYSGFCMDINELVNVTNELKAGEDRFRSIVEQAPLAIGLLRGRDMVIEVGNDMIFEVWGKPKSITGLPLLEALPEIQDQVFMDLLRAVYDTGEPFVANGIKAVLDRKKRLEDVYFDVVYTPLRSASGVITGVMVLATEVTAQILAKQKIEVSEAKLRSVISTAPLGISLFNGPDFIIEHANHTFIEILGKGPNIEGKLLRDAMPELITENQPFLAILENVYRTGEMYQSFGTPVTINRQGEMVVNYYNITYAPLFDAEGKVYAIIDISIDVSVEVRTRRELEESELFNRTIIQNSPVAKIVFIGDQMIITTANKNMLELLGRDDTIIGLPFMTAMPELTGTPLTERMLNVYRTGETFYQSEEKILLIKNGEPYTGYYNYTYKALTNITGQVYGVMATATEVTDQVEERLKIQEAQASLRGAIELAELGTWTLDLRTRTMEYSPRLRDWCGIGEDEIITIDRAYEAIDKSFWPAIRESMTHAITPGTNGIYDVEYHLNSQFTGVSRILHAQGKAYSDEAGIPQKVIGSVQDVTIQRQVQLALEVEVQERTQELAVVNEELQSMNEELGATNEELAETNDHLIHSNEELEQYAYVASHDLQEPLRKIRVFSDLLVKLDQLPEESTKWIFKIQQSAERMTLLIYNLLEFSRLLKSDDIFVPVDLNSIVRGVVTDFDLAVEEKSAAIHIGKLPDVMAVDLQMNQLFYNLISNALKFSREGVKPLISIDSEIEDHDLVRRFMKPNLYATYYHITVSDNGIGLDPNYSSHIFEIFKRLHTKDAYPGSGIGLALCKRIVAKHKGYIYVESEVNRGTTFHVVLPDRN